MSSDFELLDIVTLSNLRLFKAEIVEPDKDDKKSQGLRVEVLFSGSRLSQAEAVIIPSDEILRLKYLLGDKVFIKFKIREDSWYRCVGFGVQVDSVSSWEVAPEVWSFFDKVNQKSKVGIWYRPVRLLSVGGHSINYQIIKPIQKPARKDAFKYFDPSGSESEGGFNWQFGLNGLERQINSELEGIEQ